MEVDCGRELGLNISVIQSSSGKDGLTKLDHTCTKRLGTVGDTYTLG